MCIISCLTCLGKMMAETFRFVHTLYWQAWADSGMINIKAVFQGG